MRQCKIQNRSHSENLTPEMVMIKMKNLFSLLFLLRWFRKASIQRAKEEEQAEAAVSSSEPAQ